MKYYLLDFFMNEYKWSWKEAQDFVFNTPMNIVVELYHQAIKRNREMLQLQTKLYAYAVTAGFSGKIELLDDIFNTEKSGDVQKQQYLAQVRGLWARMGRDPRKLEEMIKQGKEIKF